jgi:cullin 3
MTEQKVKKLEINSNLELKLVYDVLSLVEGALNPTIEMLKTYTINEGLLIVEDEQKDKNPLDLVECIIDLRVKYDELLLKSFSKQIKEVKVRDKEFSKAIKDAFDLIVNTNRRVPEYLSLLLDKKLKKGKNQIEDKDQDYFFDRIILLFRHVKEKDAFHEYYKNHLAKRLLSQRSASDDAEKLFISKLKKEFGYQFTAKLEGMFKDVKISKDINQEWKEYQVKLEKKPEIELTVQVLTHGCWPVTSNCSMELPSYIETGCSIFKDYYLGKYSGRRLTWMYNMGTADIRANGYQKKYDLTVSTYQMGIMLRFNQQEKISFAELLNQTKIPSNDLKKNLIALCLATDKENPNSKLLLRETKDKKEIDGDTLFVPNEDFSSKLIKVKILPVVMKESNEQNLETNEKINEERKWVLDAVIVRIMKMRKKLEHRQLVLESTQQLSSRFMPSPEMIKKRIESLIDREYLERSEEDRNFYHYLA